MFAGDSTTEMDEAADTYKKGRECDEYNRATVREHEQLKSETRTQEIMQREQRDLFIQESEHTRQDERDVDKQLRQSDLCSGLDRQVAEQEKARENSKTCNEKWMFGGDSATEVNDAADTLKKGRACDEYNRATVREHEQLRKQDRRDELEQGKIDDEKIKQWFHNEDKSSQDCFRVQKHSAE
uniref:Uncharacterized protein n=1 Tax=Cacopsylla melanoneura TaxID=428564 RepID=A0A8D8S717_9HEMI